MSLGFFVTADQDGHTQVIAERETDSQREKVNIYIQAENREKGKGERHGMRHESGIQSTSNVF
jgi:hypothetical protein